MEERRPSPFGGSVVATRSNHDTDARAAIAAGFERWEAHLRDGLTRMKTRGKLREDADPAALATATMASLQGGLLLTQVRRDPRQLPHRPQRSAREPPPRRRLTMGRSAVDIEPMAPSGRNPW
jgi:hypothetical protein